MFNQNLINDFFRTFVCRFCGGFDYLVEFSRSFFGDLFNILASFNEFVGPFWCFKSFGWSLDQFCLIRIWLVIILGPLFAIFSAFCGGSDNLEAIFFEISSIFRRISTNFQDSLRLFTRFCNAISKLNGINWGSLDIFEILCCSHSTSTASIKTSETKWFKSSQ